MTVKSITKSKKSGYVFVAIEDSSTIKACSYNKNTKQLNVTFTNKTVYTYDGVSYARFSRLVNAESVGSYFAKHVKGKYISTKRTFVVANEFISTLGRSFS